MDSSASDSMKMALLISSFSIMSEYRSITVSVNTLQRNFTTWSYLSMLLIEESRRLSMFTGLSSSQQDTKQGDTVANTNTYLNSGKSARRDVKREGSPILCYNCDRLGHIATQCRKDNTYIEKEPFKRWGKACSRQSKNLSYIRKQYGL